MKAKWMGTLVVTALGIGLGAGTVVAQDPVPPPAPTTVQLAKSLFGAFDVDGRADGWRAELEARGNSDVYVVDNKFNPGAQTTWHTHPGPSLILVAHGSVTNYASDAPGCAPQTYGEGSGFIDSGGTDVHMLRNEGTVPAETIAIQILPQGALRKTDMPAPDCNAGGHGHCHWAGFSPLAGCKAGWRPEGWR